MTTIVPQSLSENDQAILRRLERQPGFFELAAGLFKDGQAWPTLAMMAAEVGLFIGGAWCAWRFSQSGEVIEALRRGFPALGMILMSFTIKFAFWPVMHINRLKRQVAELELRLTRSAR